MKENKLVRYIIKANGETVGWSFNKKHAEYIAWKFEYECLVQEEPFEPVMEIVEEAI